MLITQLKSYWKPIKISSTPETKEEIKFFKKILYLYLIAFCLIFLYHYFNFTDNIDIVVFLPAYGCGLFSGVYLLTFILCNLGTVNNKFRTIYKILIYFFILNIFLLNIAAYGDQMYTTQQDIHKTSTEIKHIHTYKKNTLSGYFDLNFAKPSTLIGADIVNGKTVPDFIHIKIFESNVPNYIVYDQKFEVPYNKNSINKNLENIYLPFYVYPPDLAIGKKEGVELRKDYTLLLDIDPAYQATLEKTPATFYIQEGFSHYPETLGFQIALLCFALIILFGILSYTLALIIYGMGQLFKKN